MSTLPKLTDDQWAVIEAAMEYGTISTVPRYGQPKRTVQSLVARKILELASFSLPVRYKLTSYGFEIAEWKETIRQRQNETQTKAPQYWWNRQD